jgi:cytochrome c oxidase cbb3-type subunit 3
MANERDQATGTETTGHEWDGIRELDTPLPRWWLYIFYATIVWAVGYWVVMPAWPLVNDYTHGVIDHSQRQQVAGALKALREQRMRQAAGLASADLAAIERDPTLLQFAMAEGKSAFGDNCAPCHGAGGQGARGYPNLNDDVWLWGGKLADIQHTITVGVRSTSPQTRLPPPMPAFGRDGILKPQEIDDVTQYVIRLSGRPADPAAVARATKAYAANCAQCHGAAGKGDRSQGVPDLTDREWLYGAMAANIRDQIWNGHGGEMPSWGSKLDPQTIKALAVYVHSLGGGE